MSILANDVRRGQAVEYKNDLWVIVDNTKVVKGKGQSYQQIQLKNMRTGQLIRERFRTTDEFELAHVERKRMEYLYSDNTGHVMMDPDSFEQVTLPDELLGEDRVYLKPNIEVQVAFVDGNPISAELPNTVELQVVETPPQVKGATVTNQLKEARCEGGARVKVPGFIENGEVIRVDTRTGEYLGRA